MNLNFANANKSMRKNCLYEITLRNFLSNSLDNFDFRREKLSSRRNLVANQPINGNRVFRKGF